MAEIRYVDVEFSTKSPASNKEYTAKERVNKSPQGQLVVGSLYSDLAKRVAQDIAREKAGWTEDRAFDALGKWDNSMYHMTYVYDDGSIEDETVRYQQNIPTPVERYLQNNEL